MSYACFLHATILAVKAGETKLRLRLERMFPEQS